MGFIGLIRQARRRRVFRSAAYYLVAAWGLLQVGDVIVEPAGLPDWSMTALLYFLILGLPIAVFLGWRYDFTDHGIVRTSAVSDSDIDPETLRVGTSDYLIFALLLAIVAGIGWQLLPTVQEQAGREPRLAAKHPPNTIAILPFEDLSQAGDSQYLGDGISDTVIHVLSQIGELSVTARTSSFAFRGLDLPVGQIADELAVANLLEGSVQREKDDVRIIARLVNTATGVELWSGYFDRPLESIFAVQDEIAQSVAVALESTVLKGGDAADGLRQRYRPPLAAYEAALRAREAMEDDNPEDYARAVERLERAIALDPDYAEAYLLLGEAEMRLAMLRGELDRAAQIENAQARAEKALSLDPLLPEAHVAIGQANLARKQFEPARAAFERALELNPNSAGAYIGLADLALTQRNFEPGLQLARRAVELDPQGERGLSRVATFLWSLSRAEEAVVVTREAIQRNPERTANYTMLSRWLLQMGFPGESTYWLLRGVRLNPGWEQGRFSVCIQRLQIWDFDRARTCFERYLEDHPGDTETINYLANLTDDVERGLANAREAAAANPNWWYRKFQLGDWLVRAGEYREAISLYGDAFPALYTDPPQVDDLTIWAARQLLRAYAALGEDDKARAIGKAALDHLERRRKLQGTGLMSGIDDVYILARMGDIDEAIYRLERAVNRDYSFFAFGLVLGDAVPDALREDPRFAPLVQRLADFMERERAWLEEHVDDPPPV